MTIKNENFYIAISALTKKILGFVTKNYKTTNLYKIENKWSRSAGGQFEKRQITVPDWIVVIYKNIDELKETDEYIELLKLATKDPIISSNVGTLVGTYIGASRIELFDLVLKLVKVFLSNSGVEVYNKIVFDKAYILIENFLYSDYLEFEIITPICGLIIESAPITLSTNLSIVKLEDCEVIEFLKLGLNLGFSMGDNDIIFDIHPYAIKKTYQLPKVLGENYNSKNNDLDKIFKDMDNQNVIDALRIYKERPQHKAYFLV